jgi:hypothetical protein
MPMAASCEIGIVLGALNNAGGEVRVLNMSMSEGLCRKPASVNMCLGPEFSSGARFLAFVINTDRQQDGSGTHWRVCVLKRSVAVADTWALYLVDPAGNRAGAGFTNWLATLKANLLCMGQTLLPVHTFVKSWKQGTDTLCGEVCVAIVHDLVQTGALTAHDCQVPSSELTWATGHLAHARDQITARMANVLQRVAGDDGNIDLTSDSD